MPAWIAAALLGLALTCCGGSGASDTVGQTVDSSADCADDADGLLEGPEVWSADMPEPLPPENPWEPDCTGGDAWYTTQYFNTVVAARDEAGRKVVIAAGRHGKYFPYFQKDAPWDNVLVLLDGHGYRAFGEQLEGLALGLDEERGGVRLFFNGTAVPQEIGAGSGLPGDEGTAVSVLLDLRLHAVFHADKFLGVDVGAGDGMPPPGITLRPVFLSMGGDAQAEGGLPTGGVVRIGDAGDLVPTHAAGELEVSTISYFKDASGAFRYDYLCVASCAGESSEPFAFVLFEGHALHAEGPGGEMFEKLLSGAMKWQFSLTDDGLEEENAFGVPGDLVLGGGVVSAAHAEDVALGIMTRELVCTEDLGACGLRERVK